MEQGNSIALGITVDPDNDVVVLIIIGTDGTPYGVPMMPDVALAFGRAVRGMAREAQMLQDELDDLDPEEVQDRLMAISKRFEAQNN